MKNRKITITGAEAVVAAKSFKFRVKKTVTLPLSKWSDGETKYLRFEEAIRVGKAVKVAAKGVQMEPAHIARVTLLDTGQEAEIILGAVLLGVLNDNYKDGSYIGVCFAIRQYKIEGKRYKGYSISEIEPS